MEKSSVKAANTGKGTNARNSARKRRCHTIAFANQKGGTCKTTTAVHIAVALANAGHRVLLVDLDGQANTSKWLRVWKSDEDTSLYDAFLQESSLEPLIRPSSIEGLSVIACSERFKFVEQALAGEIAVEQRFRAMLEPLTPNWDFICVDCPPSVGFATVSAFVACRGVVIPVEMGAMAYEASGKTVKTMENVRKRLNPKLQLVGVLACRTNGQHLVSKEISAKLREHYGEFSFEAHVRETVRLKEAYGHSLPISVYDPKGTGTEDYANAAKELLLRAAKLT